MKKILLTVFASCYAFVGTSQISIIPKIGISVTNLNAGDDVSKYYDVKSKIGMVIGVGAEFDITDKFATQPELLLHQKGFKFEYQESNGGNFYEASAKYTLNYLELPVLFKLKFNDFYVNAGPSIGFGIGGKYEYDYSSTFSNPPLTESGSGKGKVKFGDDPANYINYSGDDAYFDNALDFGLQAGAGYIIAGKILIDVRYGLGLSNLLDKGPENGIDDDNTSKNRSLQFTLGVPLPLSAK